jgi:4-hydroxy-L-threonine phosphate dehydrogenase PdxA
VITISAGDPAGIGPEVIVKALITGKPADCCQPVVVGSLELISKTLKDCSSDWQAISISDLSQAGSGHGLIDVLDIGELDLRQVATGKACEESGRANGIWLRTAADLVQRGDAGATVMGPVNSESLKLAKVALGDMLGMEPGKRYLSLLSGPLRVVHIFDHVYLQDVCRLISEDIVLNAIEDTHRSMEQWGMKRPRIAVAGLNPHANGPQENDAIIPAIKKAKDSGIKVEGPISPDTVFRQAIEGKHDIVIAMFHDQGHIAIKTWGFAGNCALFLGAAYPFLSVGHGTAYDIAGKGIAQPDMMLSAILQGASLAAGNGFLSR